MNALEQALEEYERQMDAMEERLARLLRDTLTACAVRRIVCEKRYLRRLSRFSLTLLTHAVI